MIRLKIFISSPGDVPEERKAACDEILALNADPLLEGKVYLEPKAWDNPIAPVPLAGDEAPQSTVNRYLGRPADCDLGIVILWSRIGTPPDGLRRPDGTRYASGTVWEYENAKDAKVTVFVYRRTEPPTYPLGTPGRDEAEAGYLAVKQFFEQFRTADGSLQGGYNEYAKPPLFGPMLRAHVKHFVRYRLDHPLPGDVGAPGVFGPAADGDPWVAPYLVPERVPLLHDIVGRGEQLAHLWREVDAGHNVCLVFLPGVGKTTVAEELAQLRDKLLQKFEGVLWADIGSHPEWEPELRAWAQAMGSSEQSLGQVKSIADWLALLRKRIGQHRLLVVLDDVWQLDHARDFMGLGVNCVFVICTRMREIAEKLVRTQSVMEVKELDTQQGFELLSNIAPHAAEADPVAVRELVVAVQGLPLALVLIGMYLKVHSTNKYDTKGIRAAIEKLRVAGTLLNERVESERRSQPVACQPAKKRRADSLRTLDEIIDVSYSALPSDEARRALAHVAIFRAKPYGFSDEMAVAVAGVDVEMLRQLSLFGLLEVMKGGEFTLHPIVAAHALKKLPLQQREKLYRKTLDWYAQKMGQDIENDPESYQDWYRYERSDWQTTKDAWLYYLAASGDHIGSMQAFLKVFFDAFWWWGYYQRFPFCERLILEWQQRDLGQKQREGLMHLQEFHAAYPEGYIKTGHVDRWPRVERALTVVRQGLGLDGDYALIDSDDARRVRSFLDFFLAECLAYGRKDRAAAVRRYAAAHDQFVQQGEPWVPAWIWFYVGQYMLDIADRAAALDYTRHALAEAGEATPLADRDPELLANLYRVLGDLAVADDNIEEAVVQYRRAVFYGFVFQAVPEPADAYTVEFYREITSRIAAQLLATYGSSRERARAMGKLLRATFDVWWKAHPPLDDPGLTKALALGKPAALERHLFPAVPAKAHVKDEALAFAAEVEVLREALRQAAGVRPDPPP